MAAEKTAYELEREARIEANKRKIAVSTGNNALRGACRAQRTLVVCHMYALPHSS